MAGYKTNGVVFAVFLAVLGVARAGVIVDTSVSGTMGAFSYAYDVEDQTALGVLAFSLTFAGDIANIQSPLGWVAGTGVPGPGETQVQWVSTDIQFDIPAFGTLSGFAITSDSGPGNASFSTLDETFNEFDGSTIGPVASNIPEPPCLFLIGTALIAILGRRRLAVSSR